MKKKIDIRLHIMWSHLYEIVDILITENRGFLGSLETGEWLTTKNPREHFGIMEMCFYLGSDAYIEL